MDVEGCVRAEELAKGCAVGRQAVSLEDYDDDATGLASGKEQIESSTKFTEAL